MEVGEVRLLKIGKKLRSIVEEGNGEGNIHNFETFWNIFELAIGPYKKFNEKSDGFARIIKKILPASFESLKFCFKAKRD